MIVLSIDQALNKCGYCVYNTDTEKLITWGTEKFEQIKYADNIAVTMNRLCEIKSWLKKMTVDFSPDIIIVEDTQKQMNANVFKKLSMILGMLGCYLEELCNQHNVMYFVCHHTSWKSFLGIKGRKSDEQKANAMAYIKSRFYIEPDSQDTVDAICLALWGANEAQKYVK